MKVMNMSGGTRGPAPIAGLGAVAAAAGAGRRGLLHRPACRAAADAAGGSAPPPGCAVKPTIVLVHGAWANAAGWSGEVDRLRRDGYVVRAPPNPLRGLTGDAADLADFLSTLSGPIVLVGHSY